MPGRIQASDYAALEAYAKVHDQKGMPREVLQLFSSREGKTIEMGAFEWTKAFLSDPNVDRGLKGRVVQHLALSRTSSEVVHGLIRVERGNPVLGPRLGAGAHLIDYAAFTRDKKLLRECIDLLRPEKGEDDPEWGEYCDVLTTALYSAAEAGDIDGIDILLENGANIDGKRNFGSERLGINEQTPLHVAARVAGWDIVVRHLMDKGADPLVFDQYGNTPLHIASEQGNLRAIQWLLSRKDSEKLVNMQRPKTGRTPLFNAIESGDPNCVRELLQAGASTTIKDKDGKTPLTYEWSKATGAKELAQIKELLANPPPKPKKPPLPKGPGHPFDAITEKDLG